MTEKLSRHSEAFGAVEGRPARVYTLEDNDLRPGGGLTCLDAGHMNHCQRVLQVSGNDHYAVTRQAEAKKQL